MNGKRACHHALALAVVGLALTAQPLAAQPVVTGSEAGMGTSSGGALFRGSVPSGETTFSVLPLSLGRAIELGLANNLGLLLAHEGLRSARGQFWVELSRQLPNLRSSASAHHLKESLAITGISLPNVPAVVGPFNFYDARIFMSQRVFDLEAIKRIQAARREETAARLSEKDAREIVVLAVGAAYLQALAGLTRVETVKSEVATASAILNRAVEMHQAGVTPGIDELRARVEWLARSQQLIVVENELAKLKLSLLRTIGVPVGQEIELVDQTPLQSLAVAPLEEDVSRGLASRNDYRAARSLLQAAQASHQAAEAQRLPSLLLSADYGGTGVSLSSMRETYHIVGSINLPLFEGGRIHGEVLRAEALVRQRQAELADLGAEIEYQIRSAVLDVGAAAREVEVVRKRVELAELALYQAQERFSAGVADNLAVIQAQQSLAEAHEGLISSQYRHNLAKLLLARAMGTLGEGGTGVPGGR